MDSLESSFRQKGRRRSRHISREQAMKAGVLIVLFGSLAVAAFLAVAGVAP
jgi:hypothetical protein